jgi:hypothetical protein
MRIFGYEIKKASDEEMRQQIVSFAEPLNDDGALTVGAAVGGSYGMLLDLEGSAKTEAELVTRYRSMALNPELQQAIDEIVNDAICVDDEDNVVQINLDGTELPPKVKERITGEFHRVLGLLDFSNQAYDIFKRFYVDGRLNYHAIIDDTDVTRGIVELRYLDPRKTRLIREVEELPVSEGGNMFTVKSVRNEYYLYSDNGFGAATANTSSGLMSNTSIAGVKIAKDSIVRVTSGIVNESNTVVLSYLHGAIKPLNQVRMIEDAAVIYTISRAPERRIFYVDVGNLPKAAAEQYLHDMMARHKNRVTYDPNTGEVRDDRKMMTMTEDYWFPRREGSRSTEVEQLQAGQGIGEDRNLPYFQTKLYKSLNVPIARLQPEAMYAFGRSSETTREELKFSKFIRRIRARFSILFDRCLERQLVLRGVLTPSEWDAIKDRVRYRFTDDNYFEQLKELEITRERIGALSDISPYVGTFYSQRWVNRHILFRSDVESDEITREIALERQFGAYSEDGGPVGAAITSIEYEQAEAAFEAQREAEQGEDLTADPNYAQQPVEASDDYVQQPVEDDYRQTSAPSSRYAQTDAPNGPYKQQSA